MIIFGRFPFIARIIKKVLVNVLIRYRVKRSENLERTIKFDSNGFCSLSDKITNSKHRPFFVRRGLSYHMGSARYWNINDLEIERRDLEEIKKISGNSYFREISIK